MMKLKMIAAALMTAIAVTAVSCGGDPAVTDTTDEHDHDHEGEEAVEGTEETATEETEVPAE